jgi:hypothetical protein
MNWYKQYRLMWINETLEIFGFINRGHLQKKFGISIPQASQDLRQFMELNPNTMRYDIRDKRYVKWEKKKQH